MQRARMTMMGGRWPRLEVEGGGGRGGGRADATDRRLERESQHSARWATKMLKKYEDRGFEWQPGGAPPTKKKK